MNRSPSPANPDELDRVFSRYFQAQLPDRWPAPPIPVEVAPARAANSHAVPGSARTRLTLAASVAALLALGFVVSYGPVTSTNDGRTDTLLNRSTADGSKGLGAHMPKDDLPPMKLMP